MTLFNICLNIYKICYWPFT